MSKLPDQFGAKDIRNALLDSHIGERKFQLGLGQVLSGVFGRIVIKKVLVTDKSGPRSIKIEQTI